MKKITRIFLCFSISIIITILGLQSANAILDSSENDSFKNDFSKNNEAFGALKEDCKLTIPKISSALNLPSTVDLSTSNNFPCIRDQSTINSCIGWATTYYQFGYQVSKMNSWDSKNDPTKQFSPRWTYNFINGGENQPTSFSNAYKIL